MSKTTLRPASRAIRIAFRCAASVFGREKCVPVTTMALAEAISAGSMSSSVIAMSAQFSRTKISGNVVSFSTERSTSAVSLSGSTLMPAVDDALAGELLQKEAAHLLGADAGNDSRLQAQPRGTNGDVGRTAANRFGERRYVLQPRADLLAVEIDRGAADGDHIEGGGLRPSLAFSLPDSIGQL